jgi:hypothetical protein
MIELKYLFWVDVGWCIISEEALDLFGLLLAVGVHQTLGEVLQALHIVIQQNEKISK